jgi:tRNA1(Val) A37 N6-methylase TrmN6
MPTSQTEPAMSDKPNAPSELTLSHPENGNIIPLTRDIFLGGQFQAAQPAKGYHRSGNDAVLLGASVGYEAQGLLVELGAGCGAAALVALIHSPELKAQLVECDPVMVACAGRNVKEDKRFAGRASIVELDLTAKESEREAAGLKRAGADYLIMNPPFYNSKQVRLSPYMSKAKAHTAEDNALESWFRVASGVLKPFGQCCVILPASCLDQAIKLMQGRFGGLHILPIYSKKGAKASRILIKGFKNSKAETVLCPPFLMHEQDGTLTWQARNCLQLGKALTFL